MMEDEQAEKFEEVATKVVPILDKMVTRAARQVMRGYGSERIPNGDDCASQG